MGLRQQTNGLSCVPITDTNCIRFNIMHPFLCFVCKPDYYPANSVCTLVRVAINFCSVYDSDSTCSVCNSGYVLTVNKTACIRTTTVLALFDTQCSLMAVMSTPVCTKCAPGYYFQGATCSTCAKPGCYTCSPTNTSACLACKSGYYQNPSGACLADSALPGNQTNGTKTPTTPTGTARIFSAVILIPFISLWQFK
jgi:hypothetical protein